ncbi:hypothetical protein CPT03_20345 [Pedobacter ginsengisoli]|uniref:DUF1800 domain-containing protein n=1 Tax=Pedobacter ginsengisoli TaxID=363852 RepID=A0A2D1UCV2_9SPHI|nr:DUF1800 domain-containing protein [Pedobacter ginsengisoli]ATP59334.1 hypothetical protein CPT03_20345 [Pedobacter ginsengisoli]
MKTSIKISLSFVFVLLLVLLFSSFQKKPAAEKLIFPYKQAGLSERQAAEHLLSRFTYGPKPGDIDHVLDMGLEKWFMQQLDGNLDDKVLNEKLAQFEDINLTNTEVENKYPRAARVLRMAIKEGAIDKDSVNKGNQAAYRKQIKDYMEQKGLKPQRELYRQFINQKILRAAYTNNQLRELLTDFWFNHFNVSLTKNQCASFIPAYERDVIRPNVTDKFSNLLLATAKSPAMLIYLDNFISSGQPTAKMRKDSILMKDGTIVKKFRKVQTKKKQGGLNENYAREVMELHTLGVDGGYTQADVTQAARVLTGWTIAPMGDDSYGGAIKKLIDNIEEANLEKRGFVHQGDFLFVPTRHDNAEKIVLGKRFAPNGGYEEGTVLLNMLAHHPSTAKFISKKIATRFVSDQPAAKLADRMAKTFIKSDGDIKQVMIVMVSSPEFWQADALREKTKSPFELAISAVRSLEAQIVQPYQLFSWVNKMGQKMYYYQAPTGFPDKGQYWINTGALLNRMNFGLALASQRIPGIKVDLGALNNHHEPESADEALTIYSKIIMPERNLDATIKRLKPMLKDPDLNKKVEMAANKNIMTIPDTNEDTLANIKKSRIAKDIYIKNSELAQVVGVILGSPEFQRK